MSIHADLQLRAHLLHDMHLSVSITGANTDQRDNRPRSVPTGQIVLQYVRPLRHASTASTTTVTTATTNVPILLIHTSRG